MSMVKTITDCSKAKYENYKWDSYFMDIANRTALLSKDPSTKVGCVIVKNKRIVSVGYNGFPQKMADDFKKLIDREEKYKRIIHAEMNAILNAVDLRMIQESTMYIYPFLPCSNCAKFIIQSGVSEIVVPCDNEKIPERWVNNMNNSITMFLECNVRVRAIPYDV